jgi:dCMP deaminase
MTKYFCLYFPFYRCVHNLGNESAKVIAQSRIRQVLYLRDDEHESDSSRASRIILQMSGVETIHYTPTVRYIDLDLSVTNVPNSIPKDELIPSSIQSSSLSQPPPLCTQQNSELLDLLWREAQWVPSSSSSVRRHEVLSWEDYFMAMAFLTAKRSKDPNTQVGACVVSRQKIILALGYNGFPRGCSDDALPWARSSSSSSWLHTKYPYVCHAEVNAILNKGSASLEHSTIYVALFPCNECAKLIIQAGIEEVVYLQDIYHETDACRASRILLQMSGVKLRQYVPSVTKVRLDLGSST